MIDRGTRGFTLVEVLVALVVTALLLGVIGNALANSSARVQDDRQRSAALLLAEAELSARSDAPFTEGETSREVQTTSTFSGAFNVPPSPSGTTTMAPP